MEQKKPTAETDLKQTVSNEHAAKTLLADLQAALANRKEVDEHKAKLLRKSWDDLQSHTDDTTVDLAPLEKGFEKLRDRIHKQVESRNASYAVVEEALCHLEVAIKGDELAEAQQLEQKIISGLNKIPGLSDQRRQKVIGALEALQPKIKKLSAWRHWGTEKAREKVIAEVRQIHEKEKDLEKVAQYIKQVREQWKQWDNSGEGGNKTLYKQFDAACSKAYEPCKKLFDAQRKQRTAASTHRKQVCELLEQEYEKADWRNPDWKQIQQLIREQTGRWRKLGPAEFRDRKPLQKRFEEISAKFDGPLDRERKRNFKQREDLIASIDKLVEMEDSRKAISEVQTLKKQWLVTVSGGRKKEQAIWKKFTLACDAVYDKSRASKKAIDQEQEQYFTDRMALCDLIESQIGKDPEERSADVVALGKQIAKWKSEWSDLGRVPKSRINASEKRWKAVIGKAENQLSILHKANQANIDQQLFDCAKYCATLENTLLAGDQIDVDEANAHWAALPELEPSLMKMLRGRFDQIIKHAEKSTSTDQLVKLAEKNFEQINQHLLRLELNLGVDSPAAYSKQRMALQIGRLSAALGKGGDDIILDNQQLVNEIHANGIITADNRLQSDKRFDACYKAMQA